MTSSPEPIACSLNPDEARDRAGEWAALLDRAGAERVAVPGGVRIALPRDDALVAELDRLVAAERACCPFMRLEVEIAADSLSLTATAPSEAAPLIAELFG